MYVAIIAALIAGLFFAIGGVLQQRVASTRPEGESLSPRLIWDLLHQRLWVAGISCAVLSYVFQALALNFAPLPLRAWTGSMIDAFIRCSKPSLPSGRRRKRATRSRSLHRRCRRA